MAQSPREKSGSLKTPEARGVRVEALSRVESGPITFTLEKAGKKWSVEIPLKHASRPCFGGFLTVEMLHKATVRL